MDYLVKFKVMFSGTRLLTSVFRAGTNKILQKSGDAIERNKNSNEPK
jgi:hypothetical protein